MIQLVVTSAMVVVIGMMLGIIFTLPIHIVTGITIIGCVIAAILYTRMKGVSLWK